MQPDISTAAPIPSGIWHTLLEDARWTPSPHNIQPWRVAVESASAATLLYDPARLIPDTDPTGQFTTIGFGIFLEYLRIAASHRGLTLGWTPLREGIDRAAQEPTPFFRLTLRDGATPDGFSPAMIRERRTSRLPYRGEAPVSGDCLRALEATADQFGHSFRWSQESAMVRWVLLLNRDTLFYDFDEPLTRNEVGQWIRFSEGEAEARKDGLAARCMRMPGWLMRVFFRRHQILNVFPIRQIVQWYYVFAMRGTTTVAWMSGPVGGQAEWIEAGRMMGRWWLQMSADGVYLHPFGSIITNRRTYDRLRKKMESPDDSYPFWMIVRMGHSDTPPASQRLNVAQILWKGGGASCESV